MSSGDVGREREAREALDVSSVPDMAGPDPIEMLDIQIHPVTRAEAVLRVGVLAQRPPALVVTPNVDHVVLLQHDADFRAAYDVAALRVCDGAPLIGLSRLCGRSLPERVAGADLMGDVCAMAADRGLRVFVAGEAPDVLERGLLNLRHRFPDLRISGHSPPMRFEGTDHDRHLQEELRRACPDIVMVCLGAPRAEIWAAAHMDELPAVYLCVGAAIDFAAGAKQRAPLVLQRLGVEWLYRLAQEPGRLWRRYLLRDAAFLPLAVHEAWRCAVERRRRSSGP